MKEKKKYLFMISHPAHFHMFIDTMSNLEQKGHRIITVIRPKDVLEDLCVNAELNYYKVDERPQRFGVLGLGWGLVKKTSAVLKIIKKEKPDLLIGSDGVLAYAGTIKSIPSFEFFEDDVDVIRLYALMFFPFYSKLISPDVTDPWIWKKKNIRYKGYQKLAYLHPNKFIPQQQIVEKYIEIDKPYFLIRLSDLSAHHDVGIKGFTFELVNKIVDLLKKHGDVYISSEKELSKELKPYLLKINPADLHHVLAYSNLFIGDSQSMTVEAAMLGVPSVRFSDFAGRISVLEELEHKYELTYGIKTVEPEKLYNTVERLLNTPDFKAVFQQRRQKMLSDKIDVTAFFTWFIENYPESSKIMKENPDYQYKFK